ncbi:hypothetical protein LCGC14_1177180 [marine sediment metagenome]|uniref:Uncharacterized protein n=1 Tax=marine sediment metagenome TaxID=412755 RepID=A0A0F9PTJ9_9ZZZZ
MTGQCSDIVGAFDRRDNWVHPADLLLGTIQRELYLKYFIGHEIYDTLLELVFWIDGEGHAPKRPRSP